MPIQKRNLLLILLACFGIAVPKPTSAQAARPLPVEEALRFKSFGQFIPIAVSADGARVAYTVQENEKMRSVNGRVYARTGVAPWAVGTDIYVQDTDSTAARNLTQGSGNNWLPVWSPDGRYLAFLSDRDSDGQAHLWVWDTRNDGLRQVSKISIRGNQIEWTPNSKQLLVTALPVGVSPKDYARKLSARVNDNNEKQRSEHGSTVILYRANDRSHQGEAAPTSDPWNLDGTLRDLVLVDMDTEKTRILIQGKRISRYSISPDGAYIAYTTPDRFEEPGSQQVLFDLAVVETAKSLSRVLVSNLRLNYSGAEFAWSPDSLRLSYLEGGPRMTGDCYVVNMNDGTRTKLTDFSQAESGVSRSSGPLWNSTGTSIYFSREGALWEAELRRSKAIRMAEIPNRQIVAPIPNGQNLLWVLENGLSTVVVTHDNSGKQDGVYKIDLRNGKYSKLLEQGQCYTCSRVEQGFAVAADAQNVLYFSEDAQHDSNLWISDAEFRSPRRLTQINAQFDQFQMGVARLIHWLGSDGEQLQGALLLPPNYREKTHYPLIVWVYGGVLQSNDFDHFGFLGNGPFNMQLLATRGYAVLLPDIPLHVGTPRLDLIKAVLPGVNKVIEMGFADPIRLGVMGHSFGGYSTLAIVSQTDRFKAAVVASGFGDTFAEYGSMGTSGAAFGTSIQERGPGSMGGTPWQVRERYIENSPAFYLDRINTPLLVMHGEEDTTVPSFLGDQIFVGLRRLGKDVEYAKYRGEGHLPLLWEYDNQLDFSSRVIEWFDRWLKNGHP
jgi:dipeptidyl aminopeptidase/acylaminoacyl peptidase